VKEFIEDLKAHYHGNHILGDGSVLEPEEWEKLGRPYVWYKVTEKENVELWEDTSYGCLALHDKVTGKIFLGKDFVLLKNYIGISECYTGGEPKLYKEV